ncbi:hypothetical protein ACHAWF_006118 [Thalassiosira exigua]
MTVILGTPKAKVHIPGAPCNASDAPPLSTLGCGSSRALVTAAVEKAANATSELGWPDPDFVLFTGDAARHTSPSPEDTLEDIRAVNEIFEEVLSQRGTPLVKLPALPFAVGNNDLGGHYFLNVTSDEPCLPSLAEDGSMILPAVTNQWLADMADRQGDAFATELEESTYACGGYLSRRVDDRLDVISLNTAVWVLKHVPKPTASGLRADPFGQLAWLRVQLENAREGDRKVYITGHIPPILAYYNQEMYYAKDKHDAIYDLVAEYQDVVAGMIFAHTHSNELRRVPGLPDDAPPLLLARSVGPCKGSDPGFNIVKYDRGATFRPIDIATFEMKMSGGAHPNSNVFSNSNNNAFYLEIPSVVEYLGMDSLTNGETLRLAGRMLPSSSNETTTNGDDIWDKYYGTWFQGVMPRRDAGYRRMSACLVACGDSYDMWDTCNASVAEMDIGVACGLGVKLDELAGESNTLSQDTANEGMQLILSGCAIGMIIVLAVMCW